MRARPLSRRRKRKAQSPAASWPQPHMPSALFIGSPPRNCDCDGGRGFLILRQARDKEFERPRLMYNNVVDFNNNCCSLGLSPPLVTPAGPAGRAPPILPGRPAGNARDKGGNVKKPRWREDGRQDRDAA